MITLFSIFWSILNCCIMAMVIRFIRIRTDLIPKYGCSVLNVLTICCILRIILPIEFSEHQFVIGDSQLYSKIMRPITSFLYPKFPEWFLPMLLFIWICGSIIQTIKLFYKSWALYRKLKRDSKEVDKDISNILFEIDEKCPLKIYKTEDIAIPVLAGYFHPAIYIPDTSKSKREYYFIFLHEYTHWKRKDIQKKFLVNLLCMIFWWNPAIYIMRREISQIIEFNCDQQVTEKFSDMEVVEYLEILKAYVGKNKLAKIKTNTYTIEFVNTSKRYSMKQRFYLLLKRDIPARKSPIPKIVLAIVAVIWIGSSYYFILQPYYDTPGNLLWKDDVPFDRTVRNTSNEDNSYLEEQKDGSYIFYYNGVPIPISATDVEAGLYEMYPIVEYEEENIFEKIIFLLEKNFHIK